MFDFTIPPLSSALISSVTMIFILRVVGMTFSTIRVLVMMRGKRLATAVTGFIEVFVYVIAIGVVVNDLSNIWNVMAYCLGFVAGTLVGMWVDDRTATGHVNVRIISRFKAQLIVEKIHEAGYGATVGWGHGRGGTVGMILAIVTRKDVDTIYKLAEDVDRDAFITVEDARAVRRGYMRLTGGQK